MAIIKTGSAAVTQISGSVDGVTYSRGLGGPYVRTKIKPFNPQTQFQSKVRSIMTTLSQDWSATLTPEQREAWTLWAKEHPITNSLGTSIQVNGLAAYVTINARLQTYATDAFPAPALLVDPPASQTVKPLTKVTGITYPASTSAIGFTPTPAGNVPANTYLIARMSTRLPDGVQSVKQPVVFVGMVLAVDPQPINYTITANLERPDITATITDEDQTLCIWIQQLNRANGAITEPIRTIVTSVA